MTPYPLSPLRKVTDSLLQRLDDNDIKTIISQSNKHTGQNSVVNLKERNNPNKKESNRSTVRMPSNNFEDAYDDSATYESRAKPSSNNHAVPKVGSEGEAETEEVKEPVVSQEPPIKPVEPLIAEVPAQTDNLPVQEPIEEPKKSENIDA